VRPLHQPSAGTDDKYLCSHGERSLSRDEHEQINRENDYERHETLQCPFWQTGNESIFDMLIETPAKITPASAAEAATWAAKMFTKN
jgi:hypothetical protein